MLFLRCKGPVQMAPLNWWQHQGTKDSRHRWMKKWAWNMTSNLWLGVVSNPDSLTCVRTDTKGRLASPWTWAEPEKDGISPHLYIVPLPWLYRKCYRTHSQSLRQSTLPHSHKWGEYEADQTGWCSQICWLCIRDGAWMWVSGFPQGMCLPHQRTAF